MTFLSYFGEPGYFPFLVALMIVSLLAMIEGVGLLIGMGIFGFLDGLLPDFDLDVDLDLEIDGPDLSTPSATGQFLAWLRIGHVPVIISLIVFLVAFGLIGLAFQSFVGSLLGAPLHAAIASVPVLLFSLPVLRLGNRGLAYIIPKDETSAISRDNLIGKVALITLGQARKDFPAQAKVKDRFGQTHYIMLSPDLDDEIFNQGDRIVLVRREKNVYFGIANNSNALME